MYRAGSKWLVCALLVMAGGCTFGTSRFSGGYESLDHRIADGGCQAPIEPAFVPSGLIDTTTVRKPIRRVAIAELGEPAIPASAVKKLRGPKKHRREVIVLPSVAFRRPGNDPTSSVIADVLFQVFAQAMATSQPTTQPTTHPKRETVIRIDHEDLARRQREFHAEWARQLHEQSAGEVQRLCEQARQHHADVLILITRYEHVGGSESTAFSLLNLLVLPAFILPTETIRGEVAANGWLIDPADGKIMRTVQWEDRYFRLSQWMYTDGNRDRLWNDAHEDAIAKVAKKLLE